MSLSSPIHSVSTVDGTVRVVVNRDNANVKVLHTAEADDLAEFSFDMNQKNSLSRDEAETRGIEYANGYVHAYNDARGDE